LKDAAAVCLTSVFAGASGQRGFILDLVVQGVAQCFSKNGKRGKYMVGDGTGVSSLSALVVMLIQAGISDGEIEGCFEGEMYEKVNDGMKRRLDSVSALANYFITQIIAKVNVAASAETGKRKRSSTGTGAESSYRVFIDVFSTDLIAMLNMPEFPCVENIAIVFSLKMVWLGV
jgi:hypothetical protein